MTGDTRRSTIELISDAFSEATGLVSTEARLLRAEMNQKINHTVAAIGMMVMAAVFMIGALMLLLQTGVVYLVQTGFSPLASSIAMGIVSALIGLVLFLAGKRALAPENMAPQRALEQINRDVSMARQVASGR